MAASALEQALAQSFAVQEAPPFLRMHAAVQARWTMGRGEAA